MCIEKAIKPASIAMMTDYYNIMMKRSSKPWSDRSKSEFTMKCRVEII